MSNDTIEFHGCDHVWEPTEGTVEFTVNRQLSSRPTMHVRCTECNMRTWLTEEEWDALPEE